MLSNEDVFTRRQAGVRERAMRERRGGILDAAEHEFSLHGFNGTSMRAIAAACGLSHTGLLHHFPDKLSLLESVFERAFDEATARFDFSSARGDEVLRALLAATRADMDAPARLRMFVVTTAESIAPDHPTHEFMRRIRSLGQRTMTAALRDLDSKGRYRSRLPLEQAANQISAVRDGAIIAWLLDPDHTDLVGIVTDAIDAVADLHTADSA